VLVRGYWVQLRQKDIGFGLASGFHCVLQDKICLFVCAGLEPGIRNFFLNCTGRVQVVADDG